MSFNLALILSESARRAPDRPVAVFDGGRDQEHVTEHET
jgi:hypothetical protein